MTTAREPKKRKPPAERRGEIVQAASRLAVTEGLENSRFAVWPMNSASSLGW